MNLNEILNDVARNIILKISNIQNYKDRANNWYSHFVEVEKDIKEGRKLLDSIEGINQTKEFQQSERIRKTIEVKETPTTKERR